MKREKKIGDRHLFLSGLCSGTAHSLSFFTAETGQFGWAAAKAVMHGITRAAITKAQGGRWSSGFWSGFASSAFAAPKNLEMANGTAMMAVVGGTVSVISGGKFANGAVSGALCICLIIMEEKIIL